MPTPIKDIRVILTDDDEDDQELFRDLLNDLNVHTSLTVATDGEHLLDLLKSFSNAPLPNLLFLDINMPGQNGLDYLHRIKRNKRYYSLPVIIYSTSTAPDDIEKAYLNGADLYLRKDVFFKLPLKTIEELFTNWENLLKKKSRDEFVVKLDP
jgi:CheY-like chemotaxis protein